MRSERLFFPGFIMILLLFVACETAPGNDSLNNKNVFFSLEEFFAAEATRLDSLGLNLEKLIRFNDEEEQHFVQDVDFSKELNIFTKADINRQAWSDKYKADSLYRLRKLVQVSYISLDSNLKTKNVSIHWNELGEVKQINIVRSSETALAANQQWLEYQPSVGYHIKTVQGNRTTAAPTTIEIKGTFRAGN